MPHVVTWPLGVNTLRPRQNGLRFADDVFKYVFLNENVWILIKISLKFVPKGLINNILALVQTMACHRSGAKPLPQPRDGLTTDAHHSVSTSKRIETDTKWSLFCRHFQFYWKLVPRVQLTINHNWFRSWLGADQETCYYLDQYWPSILTHICITHTQWVREIFLTHWGRVTHIYVGRLTIIGPDNGLSPGRRQAIIWTNAGILLIGHLGTNFSEILINIYTFSFKKMHLKMSSGNWRASCLGLNVLNIEHKDIHSTPLSPSFE